MQRTTSDFRAGGALIMIASDKRRPCAKFELNEDWRIHKILASRNCDELITDRFHRIVANQNRQPFLYRQTFEGGSYIRDRVYRWHGYARLHAVAIRYI